VKTPRIHLRDMGAERSFSTPLLVGSVLLLAAILFLLGVVPLVMCPRCTGYEPGISTATGFICPVCGGKKKVPWLKRFQWRGTPYMEAERPK
jgi:anaerobic ribonucleoside-triphosphate reductase